MAETVKAAPPYCLVFISDPNGGELPTWTGELSVASTETCIALGCMMDSDGDTEFTLGQRSEVDPGGIPVFEGKLKTPSFGVVLYSAEDKTILKIPAFQDETMVRVWTNRLRQPDRMIIGIE
jgi:hypothetical protein